MLIKSGCIAKINWFMLRQFFKTLTHATVLQTVYIYSRGAVVCIIKYFVSFKSHYLPPPSVWSWTSLWLCPTRTPSLIGPWTCWRTASSGPALSLLTCTLGALKCRRTSSSKSAWTSMRWSAPTRSKTGERWVKSRKMYIYQKVSKRTKNSGSHGFPITQVLGSRTESRSYGWSPLRLGWLCIPAGYHRARDHQDPDGEGVASGRVPAADALPLLRRRLVSVTRRGFFIFLENQCIKSLIVKFSPSLWTKPKYLFFVW